MNTKGQQANYKFRQLFVNKKQTNHRPFFSLAHHIDCMELQSEKKGGGASEGHRKDVEKAAGGMWGWRRGQGRPD